MVKPKAKRVAVMFIKKTFGLSNRRSCSLIGLWRSTQHYQLKDPNKDDQIKKRMHQVVNEHRKWGCPMVHMILRREKLVVNKKRTERIYYREEKLSLKVRKRRKKAIIVRSPMPKPIKANEQWAMDFVHDSLWNGRKIRTLNIIDVFTKEALYIQVDTSIGGEHVVCILEMLIATRGLPKRITVDNGPEFAGKALDRWAYKNQVVLDFIRPGKPVDNCFIESFNGRFRSECLNSHYFDSLSEARLIIEEWREKYNNFRPKKALNGLTPTEFYEQEQTKSTDSVNLGLVH